MKQCLKNLELGSKVINSLHKWNFHLFGVVHICELLDHVECQLDGLQEILDCVEYN